MAIDLDGTLLDSKKQISEENKKYIRLAMDKGVKIVVCSGRIFAGARIFAKEIGTLEPLIACNGAIIKDLESEEIIFTDSLAIEECLKVIDICHEENVYFHVYKGDTMYTEKLEFSSLFYWERNKQLPETDRVDIKLVDSIQDIIHGGRAPISKIVVISEDDMKLSATRKKVEDIEKIEVTSSFFNNFEVLNFGVNKGKALKILSDKFSISHKEVLAIGDNENDISMLEFAGLGVAMGNAEEKVKEIANYITLNNDLNGVAETIKKFLL